ncbi:Monocarboxylate transporter 14 [Mizuhopecten yessoensis]|uniref:Monocarboxylate transporter 14 n=1 Tax=Mizuhopecten yessoensis TaxID=6573 RepID=A0A210QMV9_MIZYE|nr:Monocarboxylate transporter 14 [Mizuhopecten yessoensis]
MYALPLPKASGNDTTSGEEMNDSVTTVKVGSNKNKTEQGFGGLSSKVNDSNIFPVGIYRKVSEATSISERQYVTTKINDRAKNFHIYTFVTCLTAINYQYKPEKDKGKGEVSHRKWAVLIAGFFELFLCTGLPFSMTVLNVAFLEEFGKTKAETSLIQSVATGMFFIAGLPSGTAVGKYGTRKVGIFGGLLTFLGTALSFFATDILFLIATVGFITGVGSSACYISASTSVGEYFDGKSKLVALSFLSFGSGFGTMTFPYLLDILSREFGWRGCLLIVSGLMANIVPCFCVSKPRSVGVSSPNTDAPNGGLCNGKHSFIRKWFHCPQQKQQEPEFSSRLSVVSTSSTTDMLHSRREDSFCVKIKTLFQNKVYIVFTLAILTALPAVNSILIFLVNILQSKGFDQPTAVFLYFFMNLVSTAFRLVPGFCKRIPHMSVLMVPVFFTSIGAVACALLPGAVTYEQHLLLLGLLGTMIGGTVTVISVTTMKLVGMKNYSTGLGVTITAVGISNTCAGPIAGYLRDSTGSYTLSFYGVSAVLVFATCLYALAAFLRKYQGEDSDSIEKYLENGRRGTKRRSSILPWKGKVEFIF